MVVVRDVGEVAVAEIGEVVVADMLQIASGKRKTFWIFQSTWRRALPSSSMVAEKVCACLIKGSSFGMLPGTNTWTAYLVTGTLKGFDQLMNLVLDNVKETTRGEQA